MSETPDQDIDAEFASVYDGPLVQVTAAIPGVQGVFTDVLVPVVEDGQLAFTDIGGKGFLHTVSGDLIALSAVLRISGLEEAIKARQATEMHDTP